VSEVSRIADNGVPLLVQDRHRFEAGIGFHINLIEISVSYAGTTGAREFDPEGPCF